RCATGACTSTRPTTTRHWSGWSVPSACGHATRRTGRKRNDDARAVLRGVRGGQGVQAPVHPDRHRDGQHHVHLADDEPAAAAPGRGVRQDHHPRPPRLQQPVHPGAHRRVPRPRADHGHHPGQPRIRRGQVPPPGLPRRHPARRDHHPRQARVQEPHRLRDRLVRAPRLQPGRRPGLPVPPGGTHAQEACRRRQQREGVLMSLSAERIAALRDYVPRERNLTIGGRAVEPAGERWDVYNPATEEVLATVGGATTEQVDEAIRAARAAFGTWSKMSGEERCAAMNSLADLLEERWEELLASIVNEVGTPVSLAEFLQVKMGIGHLRWFAEAAKKDRTVHLGPYDIPVPTESDVDHYPVGVVAAITGYNYPLNLAGFKYGAALAAGCTVVLLPSPRTPLTTLLLGEIIRESDLPDGVIYVVHGGADIGQYPAFHPGVDKVSFTGSDAVGAKIMEQAAANLNDVVLELGGKSANIVLPGRDG